MQRSRIAGSTQPRTIRVTAGRLALILTFVLGMLAVGGAPASATFSPWESRGGTLVGEPASVSWAPGRIDVFARGTDNHLWHQAYENGWTGWENLGGSLSSAPGVASWAPGRLDVFARGTAGDLVHRYYDNGWSAWESLSAPGTITSSPTATSWGPGRIDVFARGTAGDLLHHYYFADPTGWRGWESLGGTLVGAPAAAGWAPGRIDVVVRGTDNALYQRTYAVTGWYPWARVGGFLVGPPAIVAHAPGTLDVFVIGSDNAVWRQTYFGGWWGWQRLGGFATTGPAVASWQVGRFDVFVRGTNGALWHTYERQPVGNGPAPPLGSGSGRRIVYCNSCQRAWHVTTDGDWYTFPVSGKVGVPAPGVYHVIRRLNPGGSGSLILPYFVGFAYGSTTDIGFHGIPLRPDGSPIESDSELGQFRSHGCVRESQSDAVKTWNFGSVGTPVIVTP
jgi:hypothetical protein